MFAPLVDLKLRNRIALSAILALVPICTLPLPGQMMQQAKPRVLSGVVTDGHHEPLRGAVVKLQVGDTSEITTYITGADGRYTFKRLNSNTDYRVWATFRQHSSKKSEISKFDSHMEKDLDFTLETF